MNNFLFPLNAIHKDGSVVLLYTLDEVKNFIKKYGKFHEHRTHSGRRIIRYDIDYSVTGRSSRSRYIPVYEYYTVINDWIVRDDLGRRVKYEDIPFSPYNYRSSRKAEARKCAEKGLPIPGTGCYKAGWKQNAPAKKNSGKGHRNRNRALCEYERKEYGIKNPYGKKPIPWEGI